MTIRNAPPLDTGDKEQLVQLLKTLRSLQDYGGGSAGIGILAGNAHLLPLCYKNAAFTYSVIVLPRHWDWLHRLLLRFIHTFIESRGFYTELNYKHSRQDRKSDPTKETFMYHADRPDIIEGSDILSLIKTDLKRIGDRVFAAIHVELNPEKSYSDAGHLLHVTNGVNPRLLIPTGEDLAALAKQVETDLKDVVEASVAEIAHKGEAKTTEKKGK